MNYRSTLTLLCVLTAGLSAEAQELQGLTYAGETYSINFMTGDFVSHGSSGFGTYGSQARSQSGMRWAVSSDASSNLLISLDSNGDGTLVGSLPISGIVRALAYSEANEALYAFSLFEVHKVVPANADTGFIATIPLDSPTGATGHPNGQIYVWNSSPTLATRGLYRMEPTSGVTTFVGPSTRNFEWLAADSNGRLVGGSSNGSLWDVSLTGESTYASQVSTPPLLGADFIAPRPVFSQSCNGFFSGSACDDCPCGNSTFTALTGGCRNSESNNARLLPSGTESVSAGDLRFEVRDAKSNSFALLLSGSTIAPANASSPCFGLNTGIQSPVLDGLRCAVQNLQRHGARPVDANGSVGTTTNGWGPPDGPLNGIAAQGGFTAGQTRHFQVFYRDLPHGMCTTEVNTTQVVSVPFSL